VKTKYGILVPSFDVASFCTTVIPVASNQAGEDLTFLDIPSLPTT